MADIAVLLDSLLSEDNETRNQAEEQLNSLAVDAKLQLLVSVFVKTSAEQHHLTAAILLRRSFIQTGESLLKCSPEILESCKTGLLTALQQESSAFVRRKLCDAIAELARYCIDESNVNHWPELLKFLFACCDVNLPHLYESALNIIGVLPTVFANQQIHYLTVIKQMLVQALGLPNKEVWTAAVKATVSFILQIEDNSIRAHFVDILPLLVTAVENSVQLQEDDTALKIFLELAENCPKFLRLQLERILDYMLKLSGTETVDDSWRHLGFEMVILLAENAPSMVRKHSKFLPLVVAQALKFMMDLEDDSDWSLSDEPEDEDSTSNAVVGETSLDRLAIGLGGKAILPHVITNIPPMLQSDDWRWRHAALMAVSAVGEGCLKQMREMLEAVVDTILPFCQDQHHRVRFAACNAIGQLANDFAPTLQRKFHAKVVPALFVAMGDFPNPRVQAHAGAAMVNFMELCPKNILTQYTDLLVSKLEEILAVKLKELVEKGTKLVLEQMVTTVATIADTLEEQFLQYYDRFMPLLKYLMANAVQKENRLLRGKTIECISLIGLAVGKEKFMQDAGEVMQLLLKVQTEQGDLEDDDPQISYMISAWARMCKILGDQFVQYLPVVMKPVLQAAKMKPEVAIIDSDETMYSEDDGWEFITLADQQKFGIKTAGLEDKVTACQMLVIYARDLKEGFVEYAEPVAEIMVPHLRFVFHELVRAAAAESFPYLLECVKVKGPSSVQAMWNFVSDKLLEAVSIEPDPDILAVMMDSLCKCIELLGTNCFTTEQYTKLIEILKEHMQKRFINEKQRQEKRKDEDYDEEVEEALEEEDLTDEQYLSKVADVMHSLFATHGTALLPFFEQLLPTFSAMLADDQPSCNKQWSLCIFDDLLEFASEHAINYQQYFLQPLMKCICDKSPAVRQAAVYGIGVMAQCCAKDFSQACIDSLPMLNLIISDKDACSDIQATNATKNAISAVTKVFDYLENQVPLETVPPCGCHVYQYTKTKKKPHMCTLICVN
ncbi:importin-5-like isoform X2 [Dysidea avara]|uniref:importin-5-like isoform X2 n=1 Tax=Dysidea avara TaxID=196820 RepID=UPI0033199B3C